MQEINAATQARRAKKAEEPRQEEQYAEKEGKSGRVSESTFDRRKWLSGKELTNTKEEKALTRKRKQGLGSLDTRRHRSRRKSPRESRPEQCAIRGSWGRTTNSPRSRRVSERKTTGEGLVGGRDQRGRDLEAGKGECFQTGDAGPDEGNKGKGAEFSEKGGRSKNEARHKQAIFGLERSGSKKKKESMSE